MLHASPPGIHFKRALNFGEGQANVRSIKNFLDSDRVVVLLQGQRNQCFVERFTRAPNAPVWSVHSILPIDSVQKGTNCPERDNNAWPVLAIEPPPSYRCKRTDVH